MKESINKKRRQLIKGIAGLPFVGGVSLMGAAGAPRIASAMEPCVPKSLVCIFLKGGADSFNFFVPGGNSYEQYRSVRNELAISEDDLTPVTDSRLGSFAINSNLDSLISLYEQNRLAVVANAGPLIRPTSRQDYAAGIDIPQSLFAHDTQQKLWQNGAGFVGGAAGEGWGGRIAEYAARCNTETNVSPSFSIGGVNLWQTAVASNYINLRAGVPVSYMDGYNGVSDWIPSSRLRRIGNTLNANNAAAQQLSGYRMEQELGGAYERAVNATAQLRVAVNNHPVSQMTYPSTNRLASQLHYVAQLISAREELGMRQQVFYVQMGGWDTHSQQLDRFPALLEELNVAIGAFQQAIDAMGKADSVTSFTSSDFGRTLTSNGDGTDHGWGGHAFVFGGAVNGGQIYGDMPSYRASDNPDDTGDRSGAFAGRIIPTTSVSQYGATVAHWMGVPMEDMNQLFPDLSNFAVQDLGFLNG